MNANIKNDLANDEALDFLGPSQASSEARVDETPELLGEGTAQDTEFSLDPAGN